MKDGQSQSKQHRGSSPPFQDREQGSPDWMKDFTSIGRESDDDLETQAHKQQRYQEGTSAGRNPDVRHPASVNVEQKRSDKAATPRDKEDETGWHDEGGEGG
jgi:hypothetical protein